MRAFEIPTGGIVLDGDPRLTPFLSILCLAVEVRRLGLPFPYRIVIVLLVNCLPINILLVDAFYDLIKAFCSMMKPYDCGLYVGGRVLVLDLASLAYWFLHAVCTGFCLPNIVSCRSCTSYPESLQSADLNHTLYSQ